MVNKPFVLLGLAAEYRCRRRRRWCANNISADHQMFITMTGQLSWQRLRRSAILKSEKNHSLSHPLGHLGVTYALHLWLVGKPVVDFIFVIIELFFAISYGWDVISGNLLKSAFFRKGVNGDFRGKGASPTNHCSRVITLSCGIRISAVHHLDLWQSTCVTDRRMDRQNYDSQYRPHIRSHGKNPCLHIY